MQSCHLRLWVDLKTYWKQLLILALPLLLSPLVLCIGTSEAKCAYVVLLMAIYWMTEALPLAVTALLPLILYPPLGVLPASKVSEQYLKDCNMVFFGSLLMALAVEESQLHRRIALRILIVVGSSPRRLMLGFMVSTAFLSMWMSNTAATAMMVPLVIAVMQELPETTADTTSSSMPAPSVSASTITLDQSLKSTPTFQSQISLASESVKNMEEGQRSKKLHRASKGLLLSVCCAANIGGTGTLTGTASNIVLTGQLDSLYHSQATGVTFATWMAFAVPQMIVLMVLSWLWLQFVFVGFSGCTKRQTQDDDKVAKDLLSSKLRELGKMRFIEKAVLVLLVTLVLLWLFREPGFMVGWAAIFPEGYEVSDGTVAMFVGSLFFFIPKEMPRFVTCSPSKALPRTTDQWQPLLTWQLMQKKFSWSILLLLGGGYAMAEGVDESGLNHWISNGLSSLESMPQFVFAIITTVVVTFLTEVSSNAAVASVFIPIGASIAQVLHINPLYLIIPITVSCSFAFMLPVATPPNSIVFGAGLLHVSEMALTGFAMNIFCVAVLLLNIHTYGYWLFNLGTYPSWALEENVRLNASTILP